jgi:hypothetical protein
MTNGTVFINDDLLRQLAEASGPCITITLNSDENKFPADRARALKRIRKALEEYNFPADSLLQSIEQAVPGAAKGTQLLFVSPDVFVQAATSASVAEVFSVDEQFQLRPWLPLKNWDQEFYLLALSLKNSRLMHCSPFASEEVPLPEGVSDSMREAAATDQPDHRLSNMEVAGSSTGSMKGVMSSTSTLAETKDEYMVHFFLQLDKGVRTVLNGSNAPLVVAGVEHEVAEYRRINTYSGLVHDSVHGAPNGFRGGEMHKRALEILRSHVPDTLQKLLDGFDKSVGTGHASVRAQEIVKAAYEGRISHLLVRPDAEFTGDFDEVRQKVRRRPDVPRDLLNEAAVETIRHGGSAWSLAADKMPNGVPVAAIFRYPEPKTAQ